MSWCYQRLAPLLHCVTQPPPPGRVVPDASSRARLCANETAKHVARFEVVRRTVRRYHRTTMSFPPLASAFLSSSVRVSRGASSALPLLAFLLCSACASSGGGVEAVDDPTLVA